MIVPQSEWEKLDPPDTALLEKLILLGVFPQENRNKQQNRYQNKQRLKISLIIKQVA